MIEMTGIAASPGIAIGRGFVLDRARLVGSQYMLAPDEIPAELRRLHRALHRSREQMHKLMQRLVAKGAGTEHTYILEAHLLMLQDPELIDGVRRRIIERQINAEWALKDFLNHLKESLNRIDDEYLQERGNDIDQVGERVLRNLLGRREQSLGRIPMRGILVSHDLSPADTVHMLKGHVSGFITELGGRTSHVSILARSMQVPAMVGVEGVVHYVATGDLLILDGELGLLIIRPTAEVLKRYRARRRRVLRYQRLLAVNRDLPAITLDQVEVTLSANVEKLEELDALEKYGAMGVGLYRTEYLFLDRQQLPDEEEQYHAYRTILGRAVPYPVVIRTLDIGADKGLLGEPESAKDKLLSPALGLRGVRYCLRHPELFEPQLRAILRASSHGPVKILIPMVTGIEEIRSVKVIIHRCRIELEAAGYDIPKRVPLGIMIETPAAALVAEQLAGEVDFFSIGTNDLIHYTIAVDRMDERLAYLYQPMHPAVLRLLREVISAAEQAGIEVSLCGEIAGEPIYTLMLLGLGLRCFSMSPMSIPGVKDILRRSSLQQAQTLAVEGLTRRSGYDVHNWLIEQQRRLFPQAF